MAKGAEAKTNLINQIRAALPSSYIGEAAGKYYFWSTEEGQKKQVCISMTCPNTPFEMTPAVVDGGLDFGSNETGVATNQYKPAEYTQEEKDNINRLIKELGL